MFSFSKPGSKGFAYLFLNVVRAINIVILTAIAASSVSLMVVAKMPNAYAFFNDLSLAFIICICFFLVVSEVGVLSNYFDDNWPHFGPNHGFTWLGVAMLMLGAHTLGALSDSRNTPENMTLPFWRLCLAAGILAITFGFVNVFASWFLGPRLGMNAREVRSAGAAAAASSNASWPKSVASSSSRSGSVRQEKRKTLMSKIFSGKDKKHNISAPVPRVGDIEEAFEECPSYVPRGSPIAPGLERPPTLQHPMFNRAPSPSQYSVASHLPRPSTYENAHMI
ncbi:hypothetical protein BX600DRAFT_125421 [Xylariales sp. PMI_506]|nr:hypothetical protein BX600DRAFT_125421 [Xylariales sp. PMI_506]